MGIESETGKSSGVGTALKRTFAMALIAVFLAAMQGCVVIKGTTDTWLPQETFKGNVTGPGADEISFVHWERNLYDVDTGSRLAIGIVPSFQHKDFNWLPGYDHRGTLPEHVFKCAMLWPLVNCVTLGFPTVFSLCLAPFSEECRRDSFTGMGLIGCYQWQESGGKELIEKGQEEDVVWLNPKEDVLRDAKCGRTVDGTKLYLCYPGAKALIADIDKDGKVAVMHDYPATTYRLFSKAKLVQGAYNIVDMVGDANNIECKQSAFVHNCGRIKNLATALETHEFYHHDSCKGIRSRNENIKADVDGLPKKLPDIDEATLDRLERELGELRRQLDENQQAEHMEREALELAVQRRKFAENGWRNEPLLREFTLKESPLIWETIQKLRAEIAARRESIARLRTDLEEFGTNPDSDADYVKFCNDVNGMLDSLSNIFVHLEKAYIEAKKFEAMPGRKDYEKIIKQALESGVKEAEIATRRFQEMRENK